MKVHIKVKANSSQEKIKEIEDSHYMVWLKEKPVGGKANDVLLKLLKKYFKKDIKITSGLSSNKKIIEIIK